MLTARGSIPERAALPLATAQPSVMEQLTRLPSMERRRQNKTEGDFYLCVTLLETASSLLFFILDVSFIGCIIYWMYHLREIIVELVIFTFIVVSIIGKGIVSFLFFLLFPTIF